MEILLRGDQVLALWQAGKAKPLSSCLSTIDSYEGRRRLGEHLNSLPYPHYEAVPASAGLLVRIEVDGKRTIGRFVNRKFCPAKSAKK